MSEETPVSEVSNAMPAMDRNARFEAIAVCALDTLQALAERCLQTGAPVRVLRGPASGVVMMRVREPALGSLFNLGEVTVTEAEVELRGERGYAMVPGDIVRSAALALAGAIVDAAAEALPELRPVIERTLAAALRADAERRHARWSHIESTRVQFDEIPG